MAEKRRVSLMQGVAGAFEGRAWHGPTIKGALRGVSLLQAGYRPGGGRNSIRDLVYHCAYWKYIVRNWLIKGAGGEAGPKFPRSPVNFPDPAEVVTKKMWEADRRMLNDQHRRLIEAANSLPDKVLDSPAGGSGLTFAGLLQGVAAHDLYHAGQISLLKRISK